jgi:FKBP-type peptidyl-prolyl cis-trans isomerase
MKKGILMAVYVVIAVAVIWLGAWYVGNLNTPPASAPATGTNGSAGTGVNVSSSAAATSQPAAAGQTITTMDGLQITDTTVGTGTVAAVGDYVTVNYTGTLDNGTVFDSSIKRGQPISFDVTGVIPGWTEALQLMPVGSTWQLFIPSNLAYGEQPRPGGPIGPNAVLTFVVQLIKIGE